MHLPTVIAERDICVSLCCFQKVYIYIYVNVHLHLHTGPQWLRVQSCPQACLPEDNVCGWNQSDVAHCNLSLLGMSLFAIFSQLQPNILYHSSGGMESAHAHIHWLSRHTSTACRYPAEGVSHVCLSDRGWETPWLGQEVMCVKFTLYFTRLSVCSEGSSVWLTRRVCQWVAHTHTHTHL